MANIQREVSQLEHWLLTLPNDVNSSRGSESTNDTSSIQDSNLIINKTVNDINKKINTLLEQTEANREMIQSMNERLCILESLRQVRIDDPWVDNNITPLQNEIINMSDSESDTFSIRDIIYKVHKEVMNTPKDDDVSSVKTPDIIPDIPDDKSAVPDIVDDVDIIVPTNTPIYKDEYQPNNTDDEEQEEVEEEGVEEVEEEVVEEEVEEEEEVVEETSEQTIKDENNNQEDDEACAEEEVEEGEEEEGEEEGMELEEISYKGITYYKDNEGFIYSIENDEPSENPVGYWKEKTQSIAFYKK